MGVRRFGLMAGLGLAGLTGTAFADPWEAPIASHYNDATHATGTPLLGAARTLASQMGPAAFTAPGFRPGLIRHIVMFRYKPSANAAQRAEITRRFLSLAADSRRPDGTRPVQSIETGNQISIEGNDDGLEQAFTVTFRSEGDRNFYVGRPVVTDPAFFDPAHDAFKQYAEPFLEGVVVFDYPVAFVATSAGTASHGPASRGHVHSARHRY